jgi:hypothetical protein
LPTAAGWTHQARLKPEREVRVIDMAKGGDKVALRIVNL